MGHDLDAANRIAAEIEKIVPYADPVQFKDRRPCLAQRTFDRRSRSNVFVSEVGSYLLGIG